MRTQQNVKSGMKFFPVLLLIASLGCNMPAQEKQQVDTAKVEEQASEEAPVKRRCEVEKKGQQVKNKLLVSVENMNSSMSKLHEVLEEHDHKDITDHATEVEGYTLELMTQSVFLPMSNFTTVGDKSKEVLELSTQYAWENRYFGFPDNSMTFRRLEGAIDDLKGYVKGMNDIPETICETDKNIAKKNIYVHLDIMKIYIEQVDKAADRDCLDCVAEYCEKMEGFVKTFRETITNIATGDFTTLNRTLADVEHTVHEMKEKAEAGEKEELHHAHESIMRHMKRLNEEAGEIS